MITTLIAFALMGVQHPQKLDITCPVTGEEISSPFAVYNYKGAKYEMCCGMCSGPFSKNPDKYLDPEKIKDRVVAISYFDPVSGQAVKAPEKADDKAVSGPSTFQGVAYFFQNADNQKAFDADPKKFTKAPDKEAIYCPVMKRDVKDISHSGGYADVNGVRYYICCGQCAEELAKNPDKYLDAEAAKFVHEVVPVKSEKAK